MPSLYYSKAQCGKSSGMAGDLMYMRLSGCILIKQEGRDGNVCHYPETAYDRAAAVLFALAMIPVGANRLQADAVQAAAGADTNWGLSFQKEGETPVGNASAEYLAQYSAWYAGDASEKTIYLTFDAGYEAGYTASILDTLAKHQVKAAFFVVGNYLETSPELVRRMAEEGHTVANHTYHHYDMSQISDTTHSKRNFRVWKMPIGKSRDRRCRSFIVLRRENTVSQILKWPRSLVIPRFSGAWLMWTGIRTISRPQNRRLKS